MEVSSLKGNSDVDDRTGQEDISKAMCLSSPTDPSSFTKKKVPFSKTLLSPIYKVSEPESEHRGTPCFDDGGSSRELSFVGFSSSCIEIIQVTGVKQVQQPPKILETQLGHDSTPGGEFTRPRLSCTINGKPEYRVLVDEVLARCTASRIEPPKEPEKPREEKEPDPSKPLRDSTRENAIGDTVSRQIKEHKQGVAPVPPICPSRALPFIKNGYSQELLPLQEISLEEYVIANRRTGASRHHLANRRNFSVIGAMKSYTKSIELRNLFDRVEPSKDPLATAPRICEIINRSSVPFNETPGSTRSGSSQQPAGNWALEKKVAKGTREQLASSQDKESACAPWIPRETSALASSDKGSVISKNFHKATSSRNPAQPYQSKEFRQFTQQPFALSPLPATRLTAKRSGKPPSSQ